MSRYILHILHYNIAGVATNLNFGSHKFIKLIRGEPQPVVIVVVVWSGRNPP